MVWHMRDDTRMSVKSNLPNGLRPIRRPQPCLLLLAAGRSRRLGRPKGAVVARGVPLLVQQLQKARAAGIDRAVVVLGAGAPRLEKLLPPTVRHGLGFRELRLFRARAWREGMGGSLRDGLRALPRDWRQVLVLLVDQTGVPARHLQRLARAPNLRQAVATTSAEVGTPMAPLRLPRTRLATALSTLRGDRGLGPWLHRQRTADLARVPCPAALQDLDTPADAANWRSTRPRA